MRRLGFLPLPGLTVAAALANPLTPSLEQYLAAGGAAPTDGTTLVCELDRAGQRRQWLLDLDRSRRPVTTGESSRTGWIALFQRTLHCSTGRDYEFPDAPFAMDIRIVGPFQDGPESAVPMPAGEPERVVGNRVYFGAGLYPAGELYARLLRQKRGLPDLAFLFRASYAPERIARDRAQEEAAGMTVADEREIARAAFALNQFGVLAGRLDAFRTTLGSVLDLPTLFRGLYIAIDWKDLKRDHARPGDETAADRFVVPITLQTKTRLKGTLTFTRPTGALFYCAGMVQATFHESEKSPGTTLKFWVLDRAARGNFRPAARLSGLHAAPTPATVGATHGVP